VQILQQAAEAAALLAEIPTEEMVDQAAVVKEPLEA
jgi:hypothetical protein